MLSSKETPRSWESVVKRDLNNAFRRFWLTGSILALLALAVGLVLEIGVWQRTVAGATLVCLLISFGLVMRTNRARALRSMQALGGMVAQRLHCRRLGYCRTGGPVCRHDRVGHRRRRRPADRHRLSPAARNLPSLGCGVVSGARDARDCSSSRAIQLACGDPRAEHRRAEAVSSPHRALLASRRIPHARARAPVPPVRRRMERPILTVRDALS